VVFREVEAADWPGILEVANASFAFTEPLVTQEEWLHNRRAFDTTKGTQIHRVHLDETGQIDAYVGVESDGERYRMFLVTAPADLPRIGPALYAYLLDLLRGQGARGVALTECVDDPLVEFGKARGFAEVRRFGWKHGLEVVTLYKDLRAEAP